MISGMHPIILSDTSCIILLEKIGHLDLLQKVFGIITITNTVAVEYGKKLPAWIRLVEPAGHGYQKVLEASLDKGEASSIAYALETEKCLLIIDDLKARNFAKQLGIPVTGTLGVLLEAKKKGHISSLMTIIRKINQTNFRLSARLVDQALVLAGEK